MGDFFPERFPKRLDEASNIPDIFQIVKDAVMLKEGWSRSGLMLGLAELGGSQDRFIGGLHPLGTNIILLNKVPLRRVQGSYPHLYKPYVLHVLMHEYLHTIGIIGEEGTRARVLAITEPLFGEEHLATKFAKDISQFLPFVTYSITTSLPEGTQIELVEGFDRSSANHIS